ncbi:MAG: TVP38/TMEM64 family protein [Deltaproteobacteria bacterium]|nr:TVP38/TMEM64 family protein [Deltaproteobacteria bacterium]
MSRVPQDQSRPSISWKKILILLIFVGGFSAFFFLGGDQHLNFSALKANRDRLMAYTLNHYSSILFGAMAVYTASTALSLPVATILSLTIGFLFGLWVGTAIILFSATLGATLAFLAARYVFAEVVSRRMGTTAKKLMSEFHRNDFNYLLFLRLVPLFPFWLINLATAFTPIKAQTYVLATAIGIIPGAFVFANLGQSLGRIESPDQLLSFKTLSALILLGIFALIPIFVKKFRSIKKEKEI